MVWKCFVGIPIEFSVVYDWAEYHAGTMLNHDWTHKPYAIPIGNGFSVEPQLIAIFPGYKPFPVGPKSGIYYPSLPCDMNLIVKGPGLPASGKEISLTWVECSALSGQPNTYARQFMGMQTLKAVSGSLEYTIEFISGYSEQTYGKDKGNTAFWRICYDGPFVFATVSFIPILWWLDLEIAWTIDLLKQRIGECGGSSDCIVPNKLSRNQIDKAVKDLMAIQIPEDRKGLRKKAIERLEQMVAEMKEVESLLKRSNEISVPTGKIRLRNSAISHLETINSLRKEGAYLLLKLEESTRDTRLKQAKRQKHKRAA